MNLSEYYEKLPRVISPKTMFIEQVAAQCGVKDDSVRNWIKGRTLPSNKRHLKILSDITKIPENELFPQKS